MLMPDRRGRDGEDHDRDALDMPASYSSWRSMRPRYSAKAPSTFCFSAAWASAGSVRSRAVSSSSQRSRWLSKERPSFLWPWFIRYSSDTQRETYELLDQVLPLMQATPADPPVAEDEDPLQPRPPPPPQYERGVPPAI